MRPTAIVLPILPVLSRLAAGPRTLSPSAPTTLPWNSASAAQSRLQAARSAKEAQSRLESARTHYAEGKASPGESRTIVHDYPDDPIAPYAALYAGMAAHKQGDDASAAETLRNLDANPRTPEEVRQRAR